jgi:adenylylsulfate kinase-like enzyme
VADTSSQARTSQRALAESLRHVRWIGGGSGAGKTTAARHLAAGYQVSLYEVEPFSKFDARLVRTRTTWS